MAGLVVLGLVGWLAASLWHVPPERLERMRIAQQAFGVSDSDNRIDPRFFKMGSLLDNGHRGVLVHVSDELQYEFHGDSRWQRWRSDTPLSTQQAESVAAEAVARYLLVPRTSVEVLAVDERRSPHASGQRESVFYTVHVRLHGEISHAHPRYRIGVGSDGALYYIFAERDSGGQPLP